VTEFDPRALLATLGDHDVRFVIIGGVAAAALGSPSVTVDLDVCYDRSPDNLVRLASALEDLHATLRGAPADLFRRDPHALEMGDHFTFDTTLGPLDIMATPAGVKGYDELKSNAERMSIRGMEVWGASLDDLIRMKRAAGRPKDRVEIEILGALRDEIDNQP
jgi:hypothetical protein